MNNLTGFQLIDGMLKGDIALPNILSNFPISGGNVEKGKFKLEFEATEQQLNLQSTVHGGFIATILDTVSTSAIHTLLGPNSGVVTLSLKTEFFHPILPNIPLTAVAVADSVSRTIGFASAEIVDQKQRVLARCSVTCSILLGR